MVTQDDLSAKETLYYEKKKKDMLTAYLLWFFLWGFGAPHFYMGKTARGILNIAILVLNIIFFAFSEDEFSTEREILVGRIGSVLTGLIMFALWVIDGYTLHTHVKRYNMLLLQSMEEEKAASK